MRRSPVAARLAAVTAALLAPVAIFSDALQAGEDDRLLWHLGDEAYRYDLEEDTAQRVTDSPGHTPALERVRLVSGADFERSRRLKGEIRDCSDLLWYYALFLPDGEFGPKGGGFTIDDSFPLPHPQGKIVAKGKDEVHRSGGGKTQVKATVDFEQEGGEKGSTWIGKGSRLVVERTYFDKKKMIAEVRFELHLKRIDGDKTHAIKQVGVVKLSGKVDTAAKQFLAEVQQAIRRGTGYLQEQLSKRLKDYKAAKEKPSQALGHVALPTFALLRSGVPPAQLAEAFDFMATCDWREVYSVSLYVMCLEAKSVRREEVPAAAHGRTVARFRKDAVPKKDQEQMCLAARWLLAVRKHGEGWWSYYGNPGESMNFPLTPGGKGTSEKKKGPNGKVLEDEGFPVGHDGKTPAEGGDRSNSQFAILALHSAFTSIDPALLDSSVWKEIAEELTLGQEQDGPPQSLKGVEWTAAAPSGIAPDGGADPFQPNATRSRDERNKDYGEGARARGWGYPMHRAVGNGGAYGSMSGAGLSSAAIAREALRRAGKLDADLEAKTRNQIRDGVAWYLQNWNVLRNPKNGGWYYYYLYSVEKAMETAGVEKLGPHEWWREGAAQLLAIEDSQPAKKGSWNGGNIEDTSFVLIFLNRATLPATIQAEGNLKVATGEKDPDAWDQVFVDGTGHVRLRQVFYALETATPDLVKDRLKVAEKGFELLEEERRPRLVPDLLRLVQMQDKDIRRFALRALQVAAGTQDAKDASVFFTKWQDLARACEERDYGAIPGMRALLRDPKSTHPLRRTICIALTRLHGIEGLGDLIGEFTDKDASYRRQVHATVFQLAGGDKAAYDPGASEAELKKGQAAWQEWWKKAQPDLCFFEEARRQVEALSVESTRATAIAKLKQMGKRTARQLIDGLHEKEAKPHAYALLKELTGQAFKDEPGPWLAWWEKQPQK